MSNTNNSDDETDPRRRPEWKWIRIEAIIRDEYACQECGALGGRMGDVRLHVHHITLVSNGGDNDLDNLLTLCEQCHLNEYHQWKHAKRGSVEVVDEQTKLTDSDEDAESSGPEPPDDVPNRAYVTVKEPHPDCKYYYWQWRDGDSWRNKYIGPVDQVEFKRVD